MAKENITKASDLRRRKTTKEPKNADKTIDDKKTQITTSGDHQTTVSYYLLRQYAGLAIGASSCFGTVAFYKQDDPYMVTKIMSWMALAFFGLIVHEFRPGPRR